MIVKDFGAVKNGWSFVQYGNVIGYVATNFISKSQPTTKYVVSSSLIARNIASPSGIQAGLLSRNKKVAVHSTIAGWSYVTTSTNEGYVVDAYLSSKNPSATLNRKPSGSSNGNKTYKNCTELRKDYPHGVGANHPAYQPKLDRDKDGWACER